VSQSLPEPNRMQNIDPTVWVDDDGRIYLYWGTFGQLRGVELKQDMVTPIGPVVAVRVFPGTSKHRGSLSAVAHITWLMPATTQGLTPHARRPYITLASLTGPRTHPWARGHTGALSSIRFLPPLRMKA